MRLVPIKRAVPRNRAGFISSRQLNRETFRLQEELSQGNRERWFCLREQKSTGDNGSSVSHEERVGVLICLQ